MRYTGNLLILPDCAMLLQDAFILHKIAATTFTNMIQHQIAYAAEDLEPAGTAWQDDR